MPSATVTKTTGETGRKVPVPRRWMSNGSTAAAAAARCSATGSMSAASSSVGGISVMWVGICAAVVSPMEVR